MLEDFETTTDSGLHHIAGAVSLARDLVRTGHGLPEWFICLDDYPDLDFGGPTEPDNRGFPVFGTVIEGLDIVATIAAGPTDAPTTIDRLIGEVLTNPIAIHTTTVVRQAEPPGRPRASPRPTNEADPISRDASSPDTAHIDTTQQAPTQR